MLGSPVRLEPGLASSIALGTHDPGLPAIALFFQYSIECESLADIVARFFACHQRDLLRLVDGDFVFVHPDFSGPESATSFHAGAESGFAVLADNVERFASDGDLVGGFRG